MTERWVSNKKYWCEYCKIFVVDNKISKQTHDTSAKHKEKIDQYLRALHKNEAIKQRENQKTQMLLKAIEKTAGAQYAKEMAEKLNVDMNAPIMAPVNNVPKMPTYTNLRAAAASSSSAPKRSISEISNVKKVVPTTGLGEWEVTTEKLKPEVWLPSTTSTPAKDDEEQDTEKLSNLPAAPPDEAGDNLHSFQLREKELAVDPEEEQPSVAPTFKRRKRK
ncbi:hypothetical protein BC829DRAFT_441483 [Chytridium lagenaria]|nr:hypothetical protein BC829DRAFT_441483 [Chytridium lagenaria]